MNEYLQQYLWKLNDDSIQLIFRFLNKHDFIQLSFMLCKRINRIYQYVIHNELCRRLFVSWDTNISDENMHPILFSSLLSTSTTTSTDINNLRHLLSQAIPVLSSFKENKSDNVIITQKPNNKKKNEFLIQYTGAIGIGNRSVLTQQAFPVSIDRIKQITLEIEKLYTNFLSINHISSHSTTNNSSSSSVMNNNHNKTSNQCCLNNLCILPTSIRSFIKTAQLFKQLYDIMKHQAITTAKDNNDDNNNNYYCAEEAPVFSAPFQCKVDYNNYSNKNKRYSSQHHMYHNHHHHQSSSLSQQPFILSSDSKMITYYGTRSVAYFEVHIKPKAQTQSSSLSSTGTNFRSISNSTNLNNTIPTTTLHRSTSVGSSLSGIECVAVGLASSAFDYDNKFPGWDYESYGYHGDDGAIFHGNGQKLSFFGPSFGVGDVIGCGLNYIQKNIFFTLNGQYLGIAFENVNTCLPFHPVIGIDSNGVIEVNFGNTKPFAFDLYHYIVCESGGKNMCNSDDGHIDVNCGNVINTDSGATSFTVKTATTTNGVSLYRSTSFAARTALNNVNNNNSRNDYDSNSHSRNDASTNMKHSNLSVTSALSSSTATIITAENVDTTTDYMNSIFQNRTPEHFGNTNINNNNNDDYNYKNNNDEDNLDDSTIDNSNSISMFNFMEYV